MNHPVNLPASIETTHSRGHCTRSSGSQNRNGNEHHRPEAIHGPNHHEEAGPPQPGQGRALLQKLGNKINTINLTTSTNQPSPIKPAKYHRERGLLHLGRPQAGDGQAGAAVRGQDPRD